MPLWKSATFSIKKVTRKAWGVRSTCCKQSRSSSETVGSLSWPLWLICLRRTVCVNVILQITNKGSNNNKDNHRINSGVGMELITVNISATASHKFI